MTAPTVPETACVGPYSTLRETWAAVMPRVVLQLENEVGYVPVVSPVITTGVVLRHLREACAAAGVELGAYDAQVLAWLARGEVPVAQVVIGMLSRAYAAGERAGRVRAGAGPELVEVGAAVVAALGDGGDRDHITEQLGVSVEQAVTAAAAYVGRALGVVAAPGCAAGGDWCPWHGRVHAAGEVGE